MTLSDRITIEAGLYTRKSLTEIAKSIHKSRHHVSKEIQRSGTRTPGKDLPHAAACRRKELCGKADCFHTCCTYREVDCQKICRTFQDSACQQLERPPYVCNECTNQRKCKLDRIYYIAQQADTGAKRRYAQAQNNTRKQGEDLVALDALVTFLIRKGQLLSYIYAEHEEKLLISQRTLWRFWTTTYTSTMERGLNSLWAV